MSVNFISVITCTYNPSQEIFSRVLKAVSNLDKTNLVIEYIIVDNNSKSRVGELDYVKVFLKTNGWAKVVVEKEAGLTAARLCGFKNSSAPFIVFFDDDNEPDRNYLLGVVDFTKRRPYVGAFGPAIVSVDFIDGAHPWINKKKEFFQECSSAHEEYSLTSIGYPDHFPYGTGLVVKREVLENYERLILEGRVSTTDRKGSSLSSCGDLQIVWTSVKMDLAVGRTPLLRICHIIPGKRATRNYARRLIYGTRSSYIPARIEMFPEEKTAIEEKMVPTWKTFLLLLKVFLLNFYKDDLDIRIITIAAYVDGQRKALNKKVPVITGVLKKIFRIA